MTPDTNHAPAVGAAVGAAVDAAVGDARGAAEPMIECTSLVRIYRTAALEVQALQGLDLRVESGELLALVGASGSGKSTLLGILAGLDEPSAGSVRVAGQELAELGARQRLRYRLQTVGFVWQSPPRNLLPHLTALENVALPPKLAGIGRRTRRARASELLDAMGVGACRDRVPAQLSGGEQQRVAIAVALANSPSVLLADEPTGALDEESAQTVLEALRSASTEHGVTTLIVTHDESIAGQVRRTVAIRDGRTATETVRPGTTSAAGTAGGEDGAGTAVEYAVVDRAGRLQLPRDLMDPLGIAGRVRLTAEPGHIGVWPDRKDRNDDRNDDQNDRNDGSAP